jgi:hypothetical protein
VKKDTKVTAMLKGLDHKYEKLAEYRAAGSESVLVLESKDIALVSPQSLYTAYLRATRQRPRPNLDQIWMVATGYVYCFDGPSEVLEGVNPPNFRFGRQFIDEWLPAAG